MSGIIDRQTGVPMPVEKGKGESGYDDTRHAQVSYKLKGSLLNKSKHIEAMCYFRTIT